MGEECPKVTVYCSDSGHPEPMEARGAENEKPAADAPPASEELFAAVRDGMEIILEEIRLEREESKSREQRMMSELRMLQQRVKELDEEVFELRSAIASSSTAGRDSKHLARPVRKGSYAKATPSARATHAAPSSTSSSSTMSTGVLNASASATTEAAPAQSDRDVTQDEHDDDDASQDKAERNKTFDAISNKRSTRKSSDSAQQTTNLKDFAEDEDDDSWQMVSSTKPVGKKAVVFIINLKPDITEEEMHKFVQQRARKAGRAVTIHNLRLFHKENSTSVRATINSAAFELLVSKSFWPRSIHARPFDFSKYAVEEQPQKATTAPSASHFEKSRQDVSACPVETPHMPLQAQRRQRESPFSEERPPPKKHTNDTASVPLQFQLPSDVTPEQFQEMYDLFSRDRPGFVRRLPSVDSVINSCRLENSSTCQDDQDPKRIAPSNTWAQESTEGNANQPTSC